MKKIGNSSGKYDYDINGEKFNKNIENKREVSNDFKEEFINLLEKDFIYKDGTKLKASSKRKLIVDVLKDKIEKGWGETFI